MPSTVKWQDLIILVTDRSSAKDSSRIKIPAGRANFNALPKTNLTECTYSTLQDAYRGFGENPLHHLGMLALRFQI